MTIPLTGAGALFVRLGHVFGRTTDVNSIRGSTIVSTRVTAGANFANGVIDTIQPDYAAGANPIPQVIANIQTILQQFQSSLGQTESAFLSPGQIAQNTLIAMYNIDQRGVPNNAPLSQLLAPPPGGLATVLSTLIQQMNEASASIQSVTVSVGAQTATGGSGPSSAPIGNPVINVSDKNGQGLVQQYMYPETFNFICTKDAQTGGANPGNETVTAYGQQLVNDPLSQLWPGGSGVTVPLVAIAPTNGVTTGNYSWNSDWATFSNTNAPDNWPIVLGTPGTTIFNGGSLNAYTPDGGSLEFTSNGTALLSVAQPFNTNPSSALNLGGTPAMLLPNTTYHGNLWYKVSSTPSQGSFQVALLNGSNVIITDSQGNNNAVAQSLTAATSTYASLSFAFHTPAVLPSTIKLGISFPSGSVLDSGKSVYFGRLTFAPATALYSGGPFATVHSGSVNLIDGLTPDQWTIAIANSYETSGSGLMALWMARSFGLLALGLTIPNNSSPTIADSLIA
jgi:hypothetical protein